MTEEKDMDLEAIRMLEDSHRTGVIPKRDLAIVKGVGSILWDSKGDQYLDLGANYGVCNVGHCHPKVVEAVRCQLERLMYVSPTFYNDERAKLQERLANISPGDLDKVFLCNSGTEANEAALKFAKKHTGRGGVVAAKRSFHGRSLGALSATWTKKYRDGFGPMVPDHNFVGFGDLEAMKEAVTDTTAAVILEPVQGEGGVHPAPGGYLKGVRDICDDKGAVFIVDEIQTGLGRTGKMFAVEHWGVVPDIITIAKSLGGGLPVGAMIAREQICDLPIGAHGSTFSGSPIICSAALATLDVIVEEHLLDRAAALGDYTIGRLREFAKDVKLVREVRGLGLMIGIELKKKAGPFLRSLLESRVIVLPAGMTTIRLLPPLVISRPELDSGLLILEEDLRNG